MASEEFDSIWSLMSKNSFVVDSDSKTADVTCVICKKLMIDSHKSDCGCQYCHKCIQQYLRDENKYCPGDKEECKEHLLINLNVHRSEFLNRKVSKVKVHCPNEFCQLKDELSKMEEHLRVCIKDVAECPYTVLGCDNDSRTKDKVLSHLSEDVLIHTDLFIEYIQNLNNEVNTLKNESSNINIMKEEIETLKESLKLIKEELLIKENKIEELKKDVSDLTNDLEVIKFEMKSLQRKSIGKENYIEKLEKDISELNEHLGKNKPQIAFVKEKSFLKEESIVEKELILKEDPIVKEKSNEKDNNKKEEKKVFYFSDPLIEDDLKISSLKDESTFKESKNDSGFNNNFRKSTSEIIFLKEEPKVEETKEKGYNSAINVAMEEDKESESREEREKEMIRSSLSFQNKFTNILNEDFIWKFDEVSKKMDQYILSEPFISNNYLLCLRLNIYNDGNIFLGVHIMKGENDHEVKWPLRRPVRMSILDQETLNPVETLTFRYETYKYNKEAFQKPVKEKNLYCINGLVPLRYSSIKERPSIVARDSLLISCTLSHL